MLDTAPFLDLPSNRTCTKKIASIGALLCEQGRLTQDNIEQVLRVQKVQQVRFGAAAQQLGLLTAADVEQALAQQFHALCLTPGQGAFAAQLVAAYDPFGSAAETLRGMRSQLLAKGFGEKFKTLAITGVEDRNDNNDNNANSLLAANLAVMFAQLDKKVVLIDANLRSERQQQIFKTNRGPGLADILADRAGINAVTPVDGLPGLSLLTAGTPAPNPAELLGRGAFRELHAALLQKFDLVILDTCGFGANGEALALAHEIDGAVISVQCDHTRRDDLAVIAARMTQAGIDVVGTVLLHR